VSCTELGGDLWGISDLGEGRVGVYVVDFAGHGTTAALNTFRLHTLILEFRTMLLEPARFLKALNMRLAELLSTGDYATMFYGIVDPNSNCLTYAAAGSPPPIIRCGKDLPLISLDSRGLPLGITASADYSNRTSVFGPGAMLYLYSDMLTDVVDEGGHRAGEAGAFALIQSCARAPTAEAIVERICAPLLNQPTVRSVTT
jgi:sigma-B regulation protein RsbU (phosphoserine phosphatase)